VATATEVIWQGAEALRPFLVAITDLEPFPGNPRRGDVAEVAASLTRFGQTKAILTQAPDGRRIVAGHHVVQGAQANGWTHVASIPAEFANDDEARAYLLADNGTHDRGTYDAQALLEQLRAVQASATLVGTGYADSDVATLQKNLAAAAAAATPPPEFPAIDPGEMHVDYICPSSGSPRPTGAVAQD
jgi:hypothetical protein